MLRPRHLQEQEFGGIDDFGFAITVDAESG